LGRPTVASAQPVNAIMLVPEAILIRVVAVFALATAAPGVSGVGFDPGYVVAALQLVVFIWIPYFAIPLWILVAAQRCGQPKPSGLAASRTEVGSGPHIRFGRPA